MTLEELKKQIQEYQYFEDTDIIDISLASIIATRLKLGNPVWLIIIGASSGGKSQILRPLALTDTKFMHRIDDLTENTFLSGISGDDSSLLKRIGKNGMIVISDLTVLFSKNSESSAAILSQFRMIYDGEMVKFTGNQKKPIEWKGSLGILAGSTPTIYSNFEQFADMGERFIYYRMKDYSSEKATRLAIQRKGSGHAIDEKLSAFYLEYLKETVEKNTDIGEIVLPDDLVERIITIATFAEKVRTTTHLDWKRNDIEKIPVSAMPMRVALQLISIAKGLFIMREGKLTERDYGIIDWCGYSLANEEKRKCIKILANIKYGHSASTQRIADSMRLSTEVTKRILQNLTATDVLIRTGNQSDLMWRINKESDYNLVRRVEKIDDIVEMVEREVSSEESEEMEEITNHALENFGK